MASKRRFSILAAAAWACSGCGELETSVGRHVVFHWDPAEHQLCGGTVEYLDRFTELQIARFDLPTNSAPTIEYFWTADRELLKNACRSGGTACTKYMPATYSIWPSIIVADWPIHTHEMTHAIVGARTGGLPVFVNEGLAVNSMSEITGPTTIPPGGLVTTDEAALRSKLTAFSNTDYFLAAHWWTTLEVEYGASAAAEIIELLSGTSSPEDVDRALQEVLGISLADSAQLLSTRPYVVLDDLTCKMELPTFVWQGQTMLLERDEATCADDDIINIRERDVMWLAAVEFPESYSFYVIRVEDGIGKFELTPCTNAAHTTSDSLSFITSKLYLGGRYVVGLRGRIESDGSLVMPRVTIDADSFNAQNRSKTDMP